MGFKARLHQPWLWYLTLSRPDGSSFGSLVDVAAKLGSVFPRLRPSHGLQDAFQHDLFDVIVELGTSPDVTDIALLIRWRGNWHRSKHPVWPVLDRACQVLSGVLHDAQDGTPIPIPAAASASPLPANALDLMYSVPVEFDGPLAGIDEVEWARWRHAHGPARDVPALLHALRSRDDDVRRQAWCELYDSLYHEGAVYEATVHAVPFLLALLSDPATPDRPAILHYLLDLCMGLPEDFEARQVPWAVARGVTLLLSLARKRSPERLPAIYLLATLPRTATHVRPLLAEIATSESDPIVLANAAYATGMAWKPSLGELRTLEDTLAHGAPGARLAAALAMYRADHVTSDVIELFFDVVAHPGSYAGWASACPWGSIEPRSAALDQLLRLHRDVRWEYRFRFVTLLADKRSDPGFAHAAEIVRDLLALAFAGKRIAPGQSSAMLSQDQRLVLLAIAASQSLWRGKGAGDVPRKLAALGLPSDPRGLIRFVRAGSMAAEHRPSGSVDMD